MIYAAHYRHAEFQCGCLNDMWFGPFEDYPTARAFIETRNPEFGYSIVALNSPDEAT